MKAKMEMETKIEKDKLELHRGSILKLHVEDIACKAFRLKVKGLKKFG